LKTQIESLQLCRIRPYSHSIYKKPKQKPLLLTIQHLQAFLTSIHMCFIVGWFILAFRLNQLPIFHYLLHQIKAVQFMLVLNRQMNLKAKLLALWPPNLHIRAKLWQSQPSRFKSSHPLSLSERLTHSKLSKHLILNSDQDHYWWELLKAWKFINQKQLL